GGTTAGGAPVDASSPGGVSKSGSSRVARAPQARRSAAAVNGRARRGEKAGRDRRIGGSPLREGSRVGRGGLVRRSGQPALPRRVPGELDVDARAVSPWSPPPPPPDRGGGEGGGGAERVG